jgi:predicted RNase H-related nuclease YkuK (DUF458 family)
LRWNLKNKEKFIRYSKDNVLQGFQNDFEITNNDIETTRNLVEAFKVAAKMSEAEPATWSSIDEALKFISDNLCSLSVGTDNYKQSLVTIGNQPYSCRYSKAKTDSKGVTIEEKSEFYPYMIDPGSVSIGSSSKWLTINCLTRNKKPFIKTYRNDVQQNYETGLELIANESKQAKDIAEAVKYIVNTDKPVDMDWNDKQKAMRFVMENVGDLKGTGKEMKQKISITDNDPCKIVLNLNTTDNNSKTTEEIFEFSLQDMNKLGVEYKIHGCIGL